MSSNPCNDSSHMNAKHDMNAKPGPAVSRDHLCPICGQPNDCARAQLGGGVAKPCWCANVEISADTIALIPEELRGKSCICHNCAFPTKP